MPKFRILAGQHVQKDPALDEYGNPLKRPDGSVILAPRIYQTGEIVDSPVDLVAKFNHPNSRKFERVDDIVRAARTSQELAHPHPHTIPPAVVSPAPLVKDTVKNTDPTDLKKYRADLEKMTVKELQAHAQAEEVDLKGNTNKEQIIKILCES